MKNLYFNVICLFLLAFNSYAQGNDVILLIDNSGSVSNTEYVDMNASVQKIVTEVLACNENNRIAIVQYANVGSDSRVFIESDFTDTPMVFTRKFSDNLADANAHSAVMLLGNALDHVPNGNILGTSVLNQTPGNSLVVYLFTDDLRKGLVNPSSPTIGSNGAFQAYTDFKIVRDATFVVTIVSPAPAATQAAAAIASYDSSGLYVGTVESYPADPDGPGVTPRFLLDKIDFNLTVAEVENVTSNICSCSTDITGKFYNTTTGNFQWNDTADNYVIEAIGNRHCNMPEGVPGPYLISISGTITISDNFVGASTLAGLVNTKEYMWRVRTECGEWSEWCCHDGNGYGGNYPIFSNGTCFYTDQPCEGDWNLNISQAVLSGENITEQASNLLTATNEINNGAIADYRAISQINLQSGFHAKAGSLFTAHIVECDVAGRPARERKIAKAADLEERYNSSNNLKNKLRIIPNPSSSSTEISLDGLKISTIIVSSLDGRTMFSKNENVDSYKLDVSHYVKGIYMVTVTTIDGKVITEKIVKN